MTFDEYDTAVYKLAEEYNLETDNKMFQKLRSKAYEEGHYAGYQECLNILKDLIDTFEQELHITQKFRY